MTWDANKPSSSESPALAPAQIQTNWQRLQAIITADHFFATTADGSQGYHKVVRWINQGSSPAYITNVGQTFTKSVTVTYDSTDITAPQLFYRISDGTNQRESPISIVPILAFVNFDGTTAGSGSSQTIRSSYNVTSVTRTTSSSGLYTITFPSLPTNAYSVSITGMRNGSGEVFGYVNGSTTYTDSVNTTTLKIGFQSSGGNLRDVVMGNVIVFGG